MRIYVANEYTTFARTMSLVGQKLTFSCQISLNVRQNLSVLMKNMQILRKRYKFLNFSAPYCRESRIQHPTCRVVEIPKYAPDCYHLDWMYMYNNSLSLQFFNLEWPDICEIIKKKIETCHGIFATGKQRCIFLSFRLSNFPKNLAFNVKTVENCHGLGQSSGQNPM